MNLRQFRLDKATEHMYGKEDYEATDKKTYQKQRTSPPIAEIELTSNT